MDVKVNGKELVIKHTLKKGETYKINKGRKYSTISIYQKPTLVRGFTNSCEDLKYIPIFDYDNTYNHIVLEDVRLLQEKYKLPPFYLFTTKEEKTPEGKRGNYHLINLKKFDFYEVSEIVKDSRCDPNYKSMNFRTPYKSWVLRLSTKKKRGRPKFVSIVGENINLDYEISKPHFELLRKMYPNIKHPEFKLLDKCKKVYVQEYETLNV